MNRVPPPTRAMPRSPRRRRPARQRGLTLIELVLAISITAVIGLSVTAMLSAVDYGTNANRDLRELVVRSKTLPDRINELVRQADRVLAAGDDYLVLWVRHVDNLDDDVVHHGDLRRLAYDAEAGEMRLYEPAAAGADTTYPLDADFSNLLADETPRRLARRVAAWQVTLDADTPAAARLVSYRLTLTAGDLEEVAVSAAALRNRQSSGS